MKRILALGAALTFSVAAWSQNILTDSEFNSEPVSVKSPAEAPYGQWFVMNNTLEDGRAELEYISAPDSEHGRCIRISTTHEGKGILGWHRFCVGQRIGESVLSKGKYRVSFDACTESGRGHLYVFIKKAKEVKGQNPDTGMSYATFFKIDKWSMEYDETSTRSASVHKQNVTDKWKRYSVDFDMSKVTNLYNAIGSNGKLKITDSDESVLENCYIAIMDINKRETVYVDNVVLERIDD